MTMMIVSGENEQKKSDDEIVCFHSRREYQCVCARWHTRQTETFKIANEDDSVTILILGKQWPREGEAIERENVKNIYNSQSQENLYIFIVQRCFNFKPFLLFSLYNWDLHASHGFFHSAIFCSSSAACIYNVRRGGRGRDSEKSWDWKNTEEQK